MTERVTIDVDPNVVRVLRDAADDVALDFATLGDLADAIEEALPPPEPAVGSVVQLSDTPGWPLYARTEGGACPWVGLTGDALGDWDSWGTLREGGPVVVFDGAALGVGG